ncbi:hypothetical protein P5V15_003811 [Pogonomyrmex californicus]
MASHENSEELVKSSVTDKASATAQSKTDEKKSPITLPLVQHNELNNRTDIEEKNSILDTTDQNIIQKNNSETKCEVLNVKNENGEDLKSSIIDKNKQDDDKMEKKQETQNIALESKNTGEERSIKSESGKDTSTKEGTVSKRKRKPASNPITMESLMEESGTRSKRKKLKPGNDRFCWRCHKEKVDAFCTACPRSWHRKCIGGMPSSLEKWICGECATILKAENAETRSLAMAQLSIDQLCMLLKHVIERLCDYPGSEPFCKPVDLVEVPNYLDYVIKPMDLSLLESNVRSKLYGSTDAFMADAKWIQHNCIVFNTCGGVYTDTSKLTNAAKQLIKVARQEVSEIEACPDCYAHGRNLSRPQPSWFVEPCRRPHPLVWAKLKGFPFWPAKAMPRVNSQGFVDVRFFGEHDRAWVSPKDLYLYSEEPPAPQPRKRKTDMDECVREITRHCRKLALMFGQFKFAPPKIQYNPNDPMQIQLMLPNYNPLEPNNHFSNPDISPTSPKKKLPQKKRSFIKGKLQSEESIDMSETDIDSKRNIKTIVDREKQSEAAAPKVQKLDINVKDTSISQTNVDNSTNKLDKKIDQGVKSSPQELAQNKTMKDEKSRNSKTSTLRASSLPKDNITENNRTSPNTGIKNNSQKTKNAVKSSTENLPKLVTPPTDTTMTRVQKRNLLKNIINPKLALSQMENAKVSTKNTKSKVLKPKTRIVDKLNAEKELKSASASKENEKSNSSKVMPKMSLLKNNKESLDTQKSIPDISQSPLSTAPNMTVIHAVSPMNPIIPVTDKSVVLMVNEKSDFTKQTSTVDYQSKKDVITVTKEGHQNSPLKRESKARKSLPVRLHGSQNIQHPLPDTDETVPISSVRRETSSTYQLLPPEAGPISARLHHDAHELARKMGHLMEEAYKDLAQESSNGENGTADNYQSTIFFLRMQIEHMKWQHQQQLAELKHNADRTLREMRASLEAEKLRSVEEARREVEEEKIRCIEETKRKQWCAKCGQEAMFYCCWNTAYCNYPCQQSHWTTHMQTCSHYWQPTYNAIANSDANPNLQQNNNTVHDSTGKTYPVSPSKLSGMPSSTSSHKNKTNPNAL